jgi:hypothetical protein
MRREDFFDLRIATLEPGEPAPPDAHLARVEDPPPDEAARRGEDWFHKPCAVTYVLETPPSLEDYVARHFRAGTRNKPRKLLREVPRRYRFDVLPGLARHEEFVELYRRTIAARPRGRDRLAEAGPLDPREWLSFRLSDGPRLAAALLVHRSRRHLSVGYGAFDPADRALDLEHFLIMQVLARAAEEGAAFVSLGMDTNRYGHHLPLGLPAYKLRLGFVPLPYEPAGRELLRVQSFAPFDDGLFFWAYEGAGLAGHLFVRGEPDVRPLLHHNAPPLRVHRIPV